MSETPDLPVSPSWEDVKVRWLDDPLDGGLQGRFYDADTVDAARAAESAQRDGREAELHDVLASCLALMDPEDYAQGPVVARANRLLGADSPDGECGNSICKALTTLEAQHAADQQEIQRLRHDVEFKDGLIWTSRVSELYRATFAAEKRAEAAEALLVQQDAEIATLITGITNIADYTHEWLRGEGLARLLAAVEAQSRAELTAKDEVKSTPESVAERLPREHPYYSASYGDVCGVVDREMELRALLVQRDAEIAALKNILNAMRDWPEFQLLAKRLGVDLSQVTP